MHASLPSIDHPSRDPWRGRLVATLAVTCALSLALTWGKVFDPEIEAKYATNGDIIGIADPAERATGHDILGWWTSGWIQGGKGYYRPLSSMLFWLEFRLWGRNYERYFILSWLLQATNTALLALLLARLVGWRTWRGLGAAALAGILFNLRHGPFGGPEWTGERLTLNLIPYWPAQTDIMSLLFSLLSLIALDRYLTQPLPETADIDAPVPASPRAWFAVALVLFIVALLFKEMAVSLPLLATALAWHRRRSARLPVFVTYAIPAALVLLIRHAFVPQVIDPEYKGGTYIVLKAAQYLSQPLFTFLSSDGAWLFAAVLGAMLILYLCTRFRVSILWMVLGVILWCGMAAQVVGGNFALITIPDQLARLSLVVLFCVGTYLLVTARQALSWLLAAWVLFIHIPILHVWGPHYLYWPAAFWALLNAVLASIGLDRALAWKGRIRV